MAHYFFNFKIKQMKKLLSIMTLVLFFASCKKNNNSNQKLNLNITGLEDLGANFRYEGWLLVGGSPVSTGTFSVNAGGTLSATSFDVDKNTLANATDFVVTIEPFPDANPAPTATHILSGSFSGGTANISVGDAKSLGNNFTSAAGKYVLATPSNGMPSNEKSGIWFIDLAGGSPAVGLTLPTLPAGWKYEGWAVIGTTPVTTGKFTTVTGADNAAPYYSGTMVPLFPGEDFLINAPAGLTFPTDLSGGKAVITIEPEPDNSPAPFLLKPLVGNISATAMDHVTYTMPNNAASFPTGTVTR